MEYIGKFNLDDNPELEGLMDHNLNLQRLKRSAMNLTTAGGKRREN